MQQWPPSELVCWHSEFSLGVQSTFHCVEGLGFSLWLVLGLGFAEVSGLDFLFRDRVRVGQCTG